MRSVTCLFFAVATLMLGDIRAGVGQSTDAVPILAALVFLVAAIAFAVLDWPGLPSQGVGDRSDNGARERAGRRAGETREH